MNIQSECNGYSTKIKKKKKTNENKPTKRRKTQ